MRRRGTWRRHRLAAVVLALTVLTTALTGLPAVAEPTPAPAPTTTVAAADDVPADVVGWFRDHAHGVVAAEAAEVLPDLPAADRSNLTLGTVRTVRTWSPDLVAGRSVENPTTATTQWIAGLNHAGAGVAVVLAAAPEPGAALHGELLGDASLAVALQQLPLSAPLVHDVPLDAWFTVVDTEVRPLDDDAHAALAGAAPLTVYQPFVVERYAEADPGRPGSAAPQEEARSWAPVAWAAVVLVVLLAWAALIVWVRRPEAPDGPDEVGPAAGPGAATGPGLPRAGPPGGAEH